MSRPTIYDPSAFYTVTSLNVTYLSIRGYSGKRNFLATIYRPDPTKSEGKFPAFLNVHGGAWQSGSRSDGEYIDRSLASSGMVVAAVDFRTAPQDPYPAQVQDVNYAIRWWKSAAINYGGDPSVFGALGISSGGHTLMLNTLNPNNEIFTTHPLLKYPDLNASVDYYIGVSAVLDSHARYLHAKYMGLEGLINGTEGYFRNEEVMRQGSPQLIVDRAEHEFLPPALLVHGDQDLNVPDKIPKRFASTYSAAGGDIDLRMFEGMSHSFARTPQPESHVAIQMMKQFIAKQVNP